MTNDALEAFIHGDRPNCEHVFQFSTTESDSLTKALELSGKCKSHFEDEQISLVMKRFNYICQSRIEENMNKFRPECRVQIGFCFIQSEWPNARVRRAEDNTYSILMNDALIPVLFGFWHRAISKRESDVSEEDVSTSDRDFDISAKKLKVLWTDVMLPGIKDPSLRYYLWECIRVGLEAIVDHELAHIVRGHQRLDQSLSPIIKEHDMASQDFSETEALRKQTTEFDADTFAAHRAIWTFVVRHGQSQLAHVETPYNQYYRNTKHAYWTLCLSLYVSFRIFGPYYTQVKDMRTRRHPPTFIRFLQVCATLTSYLNKMPHLAGKLDKVQDLKSFEVAYCDVMGIRFDNSLGEFWLTNDCLLYGRTLTRNLDIISRKFDNPFPSRN